jgi:hypothetical protein
MSNITINIDNDFILNKNIQGEVVKITIETTEEIYNLNNSSKKKISKGDLKTLLDNDSLWK